ncbi:hypothetical protein AB0C28_50130 [Nonomuraea sp. NPDC048892]|uniref:hypothetical protein n=1 Tax=Nonomuraea sp. NPDC048892 TaxID=3154624 RepID=UPI0033D5E039
MYLADGFASGFATGYAESYTRHCPEDCEKAYAEGYARGYARFVLKALERRRIPTDKPVRDKIMGTTDLALLEEWLMHIVDAITLEEVFEEETPDGAPSPEVTK